MHPRSIVVAAVVACAAGCAHVPSDEAAYPPVIFVHGAFGDASRWTTTLWRFESNGWPRERLFAFDVIYPIAGPEFDKPQPRRTTAGEHTAQLAAEVERVRRLTGADKVVLVANSRGGLAVRDYLRSDEGRRVVSRAILGGTPNHGIWNTPEYLPRYEFNGSGPLLTSLNAPRGPGGLEITQGVAFMTIRSDGLDKWTQPDGRWVGQPKLRTNVSHESPELKGAENIVLAGADHLETSYGPEAFAHTYRFITGRQPATKAVVAERSIVLDGKVSTGNEATNIPAAGATIEVYEVACESGERIGQAVHTKTTGGDGMWGPFAAKPTACYEFVGWAEGTAINHTYRSPFPRSSAVVQMRLVPLDDNDRKAASVIRMIRSRGFLALGRTRMTLDGKDPPGIQSGVPGLNVSTLRLDEPTMRSVVAEYDAERIAVRTWPVRENRLVRAEFHY